MSQKVKNNSLFNRVSLLKVTLLVACFVFLFAFIMVNGENVDVIDGNLVVSSEFGNVADAAEATSGGTSEYVAGNSVTNPVSVSSFVDSKGGKGFPGVNGATSWSYNEGTISNFSEKNVESNGWGGDGFIGIGKVEPEFSNTYSGSSYSIVINAGGNFEVVSLFNYRVSDAIGTLISNDNITATCTVTYSLSNTAGSNRKLGFFASEKNLSCADIKTNVDSYTSKLVGSGTAFTLPKNSGYITFVLYSASASAGWFQGQEMTYTLSNVSLKFDFTLNTVTDSANTTISDGSAPVAVSQFETATDTFSPYVEDITSGAGWPLYYDSIASNLSKATDSVIAGAGKLRSYTNTYSTINGKQYYKYSKVEYVDTYNYAKTGSYSYATMQGLKDNSGNLDLTKIQDYLRYAGLADKYANISSVNTNQIANELYLPYVSGNVNYSAGIKEVIVGNQYTTTDENALGAVFNLYDIAVGSSQTKTIYGTTTKTGSKNYKEIGQAKVTKTNRGRITVECYIWDNDDVNTKVTDYSGLYVQKKITFSGIDKNAPTSGADKTKFSNSGLAFDTSDYIKTDISKVLWYRESSYLEGMSIDLYLDDSDDIFSSPYVWFLITHKANSASELPTTATPLSYDKNSKNIKTNSGSVVQPLAFNTITSFTYDFATGKTKGYGESTPTLGNPNGIEETKGFGYYRFDIYLFDLVGNAGQIVTYFMKVDYETPSYDVSLSFVDDKTGNVQNITSAENGTKWATGATTLTLSASKLNQSGNTIVFADGDGNQHSFGFNTTKGITRYDSTKYPSGTAKVEGITLMHALGKTTKMDVSYASSAGKYNIIFTFTSVKTNDLYDDVVWMPEFNMYVCDEYQSIDEIESDDMAVSYVNSVWKGGVNVLIDRNNPRTPTMLDADEDKVYIYNGNNNYSSKIEGERSWWTGSLSSFGIYLGFKDDLQTSDYAKDVKVYYGIKTVYNQTDLTALKNVGIENIYKSVTESNGLTYFDNLVIKKSDLLDELNTEMAIDLLAVKAAGMRMIYVWAVDQAGNASGLNTYFVLADPTNYSVRSQLADNPLLSKDAASISQTNIEGSNATSFKRGETVKISLGLEQDYASYKFNRAYGDGEFETVLINNSNAKDFKLVNEEESVLLTFANEKGEVFNSEGIATISYIVDDINIISGLDLNITFEFIYRQIVDYSVTSNSVVYTGEAANVPIAYAEGDEAASASLKVKFVDDKGNFLYVTAKGETTTNVSEAKIVDEKPVEFVPVTPESYFMVTLIDKEDVSFVAYDYALDEEGNQILEVRPFSITKGLITITATATTSTFGDVPTLSYATEGIDPASAEYANLAKGQLKLNVDTNDYSKLAVGKYQIIVNPEYPFDAGKNFDITFISDFHTISAKQITINICADKKSYGDVDPEFKFYVDKSTVSGDILEDAFVGYIALTDSYCSENDIDDTAFNYTEYAYYLAGARVSRVSGESVGKYKYESDTSLFDISNNYKLVISTTNEFEIVARTILLDVSGQSTSVEYGTNVTTTVAPYVVPSYKLDIKDMAYVSALTALLNGKLSLDVLSESFADPIYSYNIVLGTINSANFDIALKDPNAKYQIKVEAADAIIFKLKSDVKKSIIYGTVWNNETTIEFNLDDFDLSIPNAYKGHNIKSATWKLLLTGINDGSVPNAGTYIATPSNVVLKDNVGNTASFFTDTELKVPGAYTTAFVPFYVTVEQRVVTIVPTSKNVSKVYGESDDKYGFGYEITNIDGVDITSAASQKLIEDLTNGISGSFARARYERGITAPIAFGTKYDDVLLPANEYYSFVEMQKFQVNDPNYTVVVNLANVEELIIEPYTLDLSFSKFKGVSKAYDGTQNVSYTNVNKAYELTLPRSMDDVELDYTALYSGIEDDASKGYSSIIFSKLGLKGAKASNYVLGKIDYDLDNITKGILTIGGQVQTEKKQYEIAQNLTIEIMYLGYEDEESEFIHILKGIIGIKKSDITVSKQYDGNRSLSIKNITIKERVDADGLTGTSMLAKALSNATLVGTLKESVFDLEYSNYTLKNDYTLDLCIKFPMITNGITLADSSDYNDTDIQVVIEQDGIILTIKNIKASITERVINGASFDSIVAGGRDYNATGDVTETISFQLKPEALADGDRQGDLGIVLGAEIEGTDYNAGRHAIVFTADNSSVKNKNYKIDVANMNLVYTGDATIYVEIARAKLLPNVHFEDQEYQVGSTVATPLGEGKITTLRYADNLATELANLSITSAPSYKLSIRGLENGNVVLNEEGLPTYHNVLVSGFAITKEGDGIDLSNYEIYGYRYNDGQYIAVGSFESGETIKDYELLDQLIVTQKTLTVNKNKIQLTNKVYDGEKIATVAIPYVEDEYNANKDELQYLEIQGVGAFARSQAGANVTVTIDDVKLIVKSEYVKSAQAKEYEEFVANYKLSISKIKMTKDILARPIGFEATLATREYNGSAEATKVIYTLSLLDLKEKQTAKLVKDLESYSIQTNGGAFFDDKNVAYDSNGAVASKSGIVYDPILRSTKSKYINYILTYASDTKLAGTTYYDYNALNYTLRDTDLVAYRKADGEMIYYPTEGDGRIVDGGKFYYQLKSTPYYVEKDDYDEANTDLVKATIGRCKEGYTVITNSIPGLDASKIKERDKAVRYYNDNVSGVIEPKSVYISSDGLVVVDESAFEKDFDGTTKFSGSKGVKKLDGKIYVEGNVVSESQVSCYYDLNKGIDGVLPGDDITIATIQAQFSSANTTAKYVVFSASEIDGADKSNYTYSKTSVSCKVAARINSLTIYTTLTDYEVEYGTNTQSIARDLEYYMGQKVYRYIGRMSQSAFDDEVDLYQVDFVADNAPFDAEKVYYTFNEESGKYELAYGIDKKETDVQYYTAVIYAKALYNADYHYCSLIDSEESNVFTENYLKNNKELVFVKGYKLVWDNDYAAFFVKLNDFKSIAGISETPKDLQSQTYDVVGGSFVKAADNVDGEYLKLSGTAVLPKSKARFASPKPQANEIALSYTLVDAYNTNFKYVARYTGNGEDQTTSKLTLLKKDMFISIAAGSDVVMTYAGSTTNTSLVYLNEKGSTGIVSGETWMSIFKKGANDYRPTMVYGLATVLLDGSVSVEPIGKYPLISSQLSKDQYYIMYLEETVYKVGENHISTSYVASNYNVYLATKESIEFNKEDGLFYYAYYDNEKNLLYKANATTFEIVLPTLSNISIGDATGLLAFEYDYDGNEKLSNVVMGRQDGDLITINGEQIIHAGEYKGFVNLKRDVKIDADDPNGYFVEWTSSKEVSIKINKVAPQLYVAKGTKFYDGKEYKVIVGNDESGNPIVSTMMIVYDLDGKALTITDLAKKYIDISIVKVVSGGENVGVSKIQNAATYKIKASLNDVFEQDYTDYIKTSAEAFYTIMPSQITIEFNVDDSYYDLSYTTGKTDSSAITKIVKLVGNYDDVMSAYENDSQLGIEFTPSFNDSTLAASMSLPNNIEFKFNKEINGLGQYSFYVGFEEGKENLNYTFVNNTGILQLTASKFETENGSVQLAEGIVANKLVVKELSSTNATAADNQYWAAMKSFMPYVGTGANLASVLRISLYYDNQLIDINGKATTIEIAVPENLASYDLETIAIYEVRNGGLEQIEYQIVNGKIVYTTTVLGDLVFVSTTANNTPSWVLAVVIAVPVSVGLFIAGFVIAFIYKRNKLKKILL